MNLREKNITVIGAVRSGIAAAKLIKKVGGVPFVSDSGSSLKLEESGRRLDEENIEYEFGSHSEKVFESGLMVISPGVPSDADVIKKARKNNIKIISEVELAYNFCKGKIIGITGTNGKTTTASLCGYLFNNCGAKAYTAGNIGLAFSEIALDVEEDEFVSLELSSFQLDWIDEFKPDVGIILNITPDHLNRYDNDVVKYSKSKMRLFENQNEDDLLILNKDSKLLNENLNDPKAKTFYFSLNEKVKNGCYLQDDTINFSIDGKIKFSCSRNDISIPGDHNLMNAMSVICSANIFDFDKHKIIYSLKSFKGVEHRLELVREINGVKYINDSKATNIDSVVYALKSFSKPLILILGGQDKGNDYSTIDELVKKNVKKIFVIGSSAEKVFKHFNKIIDIEIKDSLEEVVISANKEAKKDDIVLLSPACASFDMFDSFEHRGKVFKEAVNNL